MLKIIVFTILVIVETVILYHNTNKWALSLQQTLSSESKKLYDNTIGWEKNWRLRLLKIMIVFFGVVIMLIIFSFLFGTINV